MGEVKLPIWSLGLGISLVALVVAVVALVLAIVYPGAEGPRGVQGVQGLQGPQGAQGPAGENWTLSLQQYEWSIAADGDQSVTIYLEEGDVLEGWVQAETFTDLSVYIYHGVVEDWRWYSSSAGACGYGVDFRYVAQATASHTLTVHNWNSYTESVTLAYWVIQ